MTCLSTHIYLISDKPRLKPDFLIGYMVIPQHPNFLYQLQCLVLVAQAGLENLNPPASAPWVAGISYRQAHAILPS